MLAGGSPLCSNNSCHQIVLPIQGHVAMQLRQPKIGTRTLRCLVLFSLALPSVTVTTTGCGNGEPAVAARETGTAAVVVSALRASDAATATISISAADIAPTITVPLSTSNGQWAATVGGIPAGANRTFSLSAADSHGTELYRGQANNVTITADQTQEVTIVAQQATPGKAFSDSAPVIDVLQASSSTVHPGDVVNLHVSAHDPDQNDALTYAWSTSTGTLSSANMNVATWTAPAALGTYPITVAVTDAQQESVSATIQMTVSAAAAVPIPFTARWMLAGLLAGVGCLVLSRTNRRPA